MTETLSPTLTTQLLGILFRNPHIHYAWKDHLSTHLLDLHEAGTPVTPQVILTFLNQHHPAILRQLTSHPLVREEIAALTTATPSTPATPSKDKGSASS